MDQTTEAILSRVDAIADRLGVTVGELWNTLLWEVQVRGFVGAGLLLAVCVIGTWGFFLCGKELLDGSSYDKPEWLFGTLASGVFAMGTLIGAIASLITALTPSIGALRALGGLL